MAFIEGQNAYIGTKKADREEIKEAFNDGSIKVLLGSASIKEGIDLQRKGTVLYLCKLDWNPTDLKQIEGRIWRFGNEYQNVRIVVTLIEDSVDAFLFQKLEEKTSRINDIWNRAGRGNVLRLEDINPEEIKYGLISDLQTRAGLQIEDSIRAAEQQAGFVKDRLAILESTQAARREYLGLRPKLEHLLTLLPRTEPQRESLKKLQQQAVKSRAELGWSAPETRALEAALDAQRQALRRDVSRMIIQALDTEGSTSEQIVLGDTLGFNRSVGCLIQKVSEHLDYISSARLTQTWNSYRKQVVALVRSERNVLAPYGLSLNADLSSLKAKLEQEASNIAGQILRLRSEDYLQNLVQELEAERSRRNLTSKSVEERIQEFGRLNYLLSIRNVQAYAPASAKIIAIEPVAKAGGAANEEALAAAARLRLKLRLRMRLSA